MRLTKCLTRYVRRFVVENFSQERLALVGVGLIAILALACGNLQAQQPSSCRRKLAFVHYQLKNQQDAASPENLSFGSLPPVDKIQEAVAQRQICLEPEAEDNDYILIWEVTPKGFKGTLFQRVSDDTKRIAATEEKNAAEVVDILLDALVVYSDGLAPKAGESTKYYAARISNSISCSVRLAIVLNYKELPLVGFLAPPQKKWLNEKAAKKFRQICLDYETPQFIFVWTQDTTVVPGFRYVWHPGGTASYNATTTDQYGNQATTTGTVTLPGHNETVPTQELNLTVYGYLFRVGDEKLIWSESREQGAFGWASRRVLEDAFKVLAKAN